MSASSPDNAHRKRMIYPLVGLQIAAVLGLYAALNTDPSGDNANECIGLKTRRSYLTQKFNQCQRPISALVCQQTEGQAQKHIAPTCTTNIYGEGEVLVDIFQPYGKVTPLEQRERTRWNGVYACTLPSMPKFAQGYRVYCSKDHVALSTP